MPRRRGAICRMCAETFRQTEAGGTCPHDGEILVRADAMRRYPNDELLGRLIKGRYAVFDVLGVGGFGAVYRVHDRALNLEVALKTIHHASWDDPADSIGRFLQEAALLSRLQSSRIVDVYDADIVDGVLFMVLELIHGQSLKERLSQHGPRPLAEAATLIHQILEGLEHAHAHGLIHRDLKPANLLIEHGPSHRLKIIDFGVAKVFGDRHEAGPETATGLVIGTVRYMAPEQLKKGSVVGPAADLYAVGLILFELLVGRSPFHGSPIEVAAAQLYEASPRLPPALVTDELSAFFDRAVAKSTSQRFTSATEMRLALLESLPNQIRTDIMDACPAPDTEFIPSKTRHLRGAACPQKSPHDTAIDVSLDTDGGDAPSADQTTTQITPLEETDGAQEKPTTFHAMSTLDPVDEVPPTQADLAVAPILMPMSNDLPKTSEDVRETADAHRTAPGRTAPSLPLEFPPTPQPMMDDSLTSTDPIRTTPTPDRHGSYRGLNVAFQLTSLAPTDGEPTVPKTELTDEKETPDDAIDDASLPDQIPINRSPGVSWWLRPVLLLAVLLIYLAWLHMDAQAAQRHTSMGWPSDNWTGAHQARTAVTDRRRFIDRRESSVVGDPHHRLPSSVTGDAPGTLGDAIQRCHRHEGMDVVSSREMP
ncbi:MAG: serine/threonine-protein kinase [Myxococcota bacterium]|nr:serine/threonine-protein kinase [Myxococcota bacterium]